MDLVDGLIKEMAFVADIAIPMFAVPELRASVEYQI
jgi:hypothetical protein